MNKVIRKYSKIYHSALIANHFLDIDFRVSEYECRLRKMIESEVFAKQNIYPTMDMIKVYAVIAMCLELRKEDLSNREIIDIINSGFSQLRKMLAFLEDLIDRLPNAYQIAEKWNINDYKRRVKDGSITYDYFRVSDSKIEYQISKCIYIEVFEYYGIRDLCKIFCITDETVYSNLTRYVKFVRHSDLSNGECCHDEVIKRSTKR